jgi:hypothetical protein
LPIRKPAVAVAFNQIKDEDFPSVFGQLLLSIHLFPRYVITSIGIRNPVSESFVIAASDATTYLTWIICFWIPCLLLFAFLDRKMIWIMNRFIPIGKNR